MHARCLAGLVVLLLMSMDPVAATSASGFTLEGSSPLQVDGLMRVTTSHGMAQAYVNTSTPAVFENISGKITVATWTSFHAVNQTGRYEPASHTQYDVVGTNLTLTPAGPVQLTADAIGGTLAAEGPWRGAGVAKTLPADWGESPADDPIPGPPENMLLTYKAGWRLAGDARGIHVGFPAAGLEVLHVAGDVRFELEGASQVTFTDGAGEIVSVRLGGERIDDQHTRYRRLLFEGSVLTAAFPLGAWSLAGPDVFYAYDAQLTWDRATGTITSGGRTSTVRDATVDMRFTGDAVPDPGDVASSSWSWDGAGEVSEVVINGRPVAPQTTTLASPEAVAVSVTGAALIFLVLSKLGQSLIAAGAAALYTRLTPSTALDHPRRREISDIVARDPGIHQRALHREVGGAWGPFTFHLRTLERLGHIRVVREGGYSCVFPADAARTPPIPHELARRLFDAIPLDGSPIPLTETAGHLGVSRELASYHANTLEARGLVRRVELSGARRGIARVVDRPADAA